MHKEAARELVGQKIAQFGAHYGVSPRKVFIKNQTSRWGSCSKTGNLNFNFRVVLIPDNLADYVVVHELCHLVEFNHSKKFWDLVGQTIPDYVARRRELRKIHFR